MVCTGHLASTGGVLMPTNLSGVDAMWSVICRHGWSGGWGSWRLCGVSVGCVWVGVHSWR